MTRVLVPRTVLASTQQALRAFGAHHAEGLVLWIGTVKQSTARIDHALVPPQTPIREETGLGYFVDAPTLLALSRFLAERRLRLIAQVHSHPGGAYHSATDDRYAVVTTEGGFSLVVPEFARAPLSILGCAVHRLSASGWMRLDASAAEDIFQCE